VLVTLRGEGMSSKSHAEPYRCPTCDGQYKLVRAEAGPDSSNRQIECRYCGGPLPGRDGPVVLKYFVADHSRRQARASRVK